MCDCDGVYQDPAVETDAEGQVENREYEQSPESLQQQGHQADLEHVGVEHHQEDDDHVEQDGNVLDAARLTLFIRLICVIYIIIKKVECTQNLRLHQRGRYKVTMINDFCK